MDAALCAWPGVEFDWNVGGWIQAVHGNALHSSAGCCGPEEKEYV